MVRQQQAVFQSAHPEPPFWAVRFEIAQAPAAGCFVMLDLGGPLREPIFPARLDSQGFTALVPPGHPTTRLLPGTQVDLIGPQGHGFDIDGVKNLLLIAEASTLPPLLPLIQAAPFVALVLEASTRAQIPPARRFPPTVELHLLVHEKSTGHAGTSESKDEEARLLPLLQWAEKTCLSCNPKRYTELASLVRKARFTPSPGFAQALVQVPMPCGTGACEACRIMTRHGERRACVDGPVFDLLDLMLTD